MDKYYRIISSAVHFGGDLNLASSGCGDSGKIFTRGVFWDIDIFSGVLGLIPQIFDYFSYRERPAGVSFKDCRQRFLARLVSS